MLMSIFTSHIVFVKWPGLVLQVRYEFVTTVVQGFFVSPSARWSSGLVLANGNIAGARPGSAVAWLLFYLG